MDEYGRSPSALLEARIDESVAAQRAIGQRLGDAVTALRRVDPNADPSEQAEALERARESHREADELAWETSKSVLSVEDAAGIYFEEAAHIEAEPDAALPEESAPALSADYERLIDSLRAADEAMLRAIETLGAELDSLIPRDQSDPEDAREIPASAIEQALEQTAPALYNYYSRADSAAAAARGFLERLDAQY